MIEIFVVNGQWKALGIFIKNIFKAVSQLKYEAEKKKEDDLRENVVIKGRRGYLLTRMYDKYIVPVMPDVLGEQWAECADDTKEICLCSFSVVLNEVARNKSVENNPVESKSYTFYPYMVTMYDLYIRDLVLKPQETDETKGECGRPSLCDIISIKEKYVEINFEIADAMINNAVCAGKGEINGNKDMPVISVGAEQQEKLDIAVANVKLDGSNFERLVKGHTNRSYRRYKDISCIVNGAITEKADMLVLPEACMPIEWLPAVIRTCTKNSMALITGIEHIIFKDKVYNYTAVVLPYEEAGYKCAVLSFHLKNHYAPHETDLIRGYRLREVPGTGYELYHWKDCWFPVYCCYELASIGDRALFSAYADVLVAVEWNKDVNYYSNILESLSRDLQLKEYNLQKMNKEYKPTPPVFDKKIEKEIVLSGGQAGWINLQYLKNILDMIPFGTVRSF